MSTADTLVEFEACYTAAERSAVLAAWSDDHPDGRWRAYDYDELVARDKCSLDLLWLRDESLLDADSLQEPAEIAQEIAEDLRSSLEQIEEILGDLEGVA